MNPEFIRQCENIAPLLESCDDECLHIPVPGVDAATVSTIAKMCTDHTHDIRQAIADESMSMLLSALKIGDFTGHQPLIDASAHAIAARLEGASRREMQFAMGLDELGISEFDAKSEIWRDIAWISKTRSRTT